jgi:hypothetical protein
MLTYEKSKLLNLALRLETAINDARYDIDHYSYYVEILDRNIQSIKKTIKRL